MEAVKGFLLGWVSGVVGAAVGMNPGNEPYHGYAASAITVIFLMVAWHVCRPKTVNEKVERQRRVVEKHHDNFRKLTSY